MSGAEPRSTLAVLTAILAFALGLYELFAGVALTRAVLMVDDASTTWWVTGPLHLALGVLLIWGGVATVRNRSNRILVPTAGVAAIAIVVSAVINITQGEVPLELFFALLYAALIYRVTRSG